MCVQNIEQMLYQNRMKLVEAVSLLTDRMTNADDACGDDDSSKSFSI